MPSYFLTFTCTTSAVTLYSYTLAMSNSLRWILGSQSESPEVNLYIAIVRPMLTYAAFIWLSYWVCPEEIIQNPKANTHKHYRSHENNHWLLQCSKQVKLTCNLNNKDWADPNSTWISDFIILIWHHVSGDSTWKTITWPEPDLSRFLYSGSQSDSMGSVWDEIWENWRILKNLSIFPQR